MSKPGHTMITDLINEGNSLATNKPFEQNNNS